MAARDDGQIAVRDSKVPNQLSLVFTREEMRAWILGAKAGEFDDFC
jgi:hypothetical protein